MKHNLQFGEVTLPCREVVVEEQTFLVPRGVARNHRNKSWQVKVNRGGQLVLSGNHADSLHGGTEGALKAAIDQVVTDGEAKTTRTMKVSSRVTLTWAYSGRNVLSMNAMVYSPARKRSATIYLISHTKLLADKSGELKKKLVKALLREWQEENVMEKPPVPVMVRMDREASKIMASKAWGDFVKLGTDIAGAHESESEV
jgi:hypothetical protein|uniref:Uncharacterized protein n=1 Tax=Pseudomonas phage Nican01 TaxID=3138540 RepID=A0AAU6W1U2_9CAUD